jgi:aspartate kinase
VIVAKLGGSVLRSVSDYEQCARLAVKLGARILVVSAMKGVTDALLEAAERKDALLLEEALERMRSAAAELSALGQVERWIERCRKAFNAYVEKWSPQLLDEVLATGERVSSALLAKALERWGVAAVPLDGGEAGVVTDERFGEAHPLFEVCYERLRSTLNPLLAKGFTVVVAGFTGSTLDGRTTTMGRGSSDLTATLVAKALGAELLYLVTESPYLMSADPALVPDAKPLKLVGLAEADAMASLGVKRFHPLTFKPLLDADCTVVVGSKPPDGTRVVATDPPPDLKVVTQRDRKLFFVGHGAPKLAWELAWELDLPLLEVGNLHFALEAPEDVKVTAKAHEAMLKRW